jgi:hypothetical protein
MLVTHTQQSRGQQKENIQTQQRRPEVTKPTIGMLGKPNQNTIFA